jgi:hypothetical protein
MHETMAICQGRYGLKQIRPYHPTADRIAEIRQQRLDVIPDTIAELVPELATALLALRLSRSTMADFAAGDIESREEGWEDSSEVRTDETDEDTWRKVLPPTLQRR